MTLDKIIIKRALISVSDKTNLSELATALHSNNIEMVATGSTANAIEKLGFNVTKVDQVTGFPEIMDGRVKTLHPHIHGGLLANKSNKSHMDQIDSLGIKPFDLVVVNLYPFAETIKQTTNEDAIIEQIDIGGPAMIRASAKNFGSVCVCTSPTQYNTIIDTLPHTTKAQRKQFATSAFSHTATYDILIAKWLNENSGLEKCEKVEPEKCENTAPEKWLGDSWSLKNSLRYGENPHQNAYIYTSNSSDNNLNSLEKGTKYLSNAIQLGGKELSYNNYLDTNSALLCISKFSNSVAAVAVVKHLNPCGVAIDSSVENAYKKAHACDPLSAFGGVIASNKIVTEKMAQAIKPVFTEVIVAPDYEQKALEILQSKKSLRILKLKDLQIENKQYRFLETGGLLVQDIDKINALGDNQANWELKAGNRATNEVMSDLIFAWKACQSVKSNAILLAKNEASVGIGMGQVNRVDSCKLAVERARTLGNDNDGDRAKNSVAASDAFFPFADGFKILADAGVKAVVEPGGSIRDQETIDLAKELGISLYFTGTRHFLH